MSSTKSGRCESYMLARSIWLGSRDKLTQTAAVSRGFGLFGVFYLGGVQSLWYYQMLPRLFPGVAAFQKLPLAKKLTDPRGAFVVFQQVFVDLLVYSPLLYFPFFYVSTGAIKGIPVEESLARCQENTVTDTLNNLCFWGPAQCFNFSIMPQFCRVPFMSALGFIWLGMLSLQNGSREKAKK